MLFSWEVCGWAWAPGTGRWICLKTRPAFCHRLIRWGVGGQSSAVSFYKWCAFIICTPLSPAALADVTLLCNMSPSISLSLPLSLPLSLFSPSLTLPLFLFFSLSFYIPLCCPLSLVFFLSFSFPLFSLPLTFFLSFSIFFSRPLFFIFLVPSLSLSLFVSLSPFLSQIPIETSFIGMTYSGSNNYLIPCWFCRFAH